MQLNASLYRYDYTDLQLVYFDQGSSQVANVGKARGQGTRDGPALGAERALGRDRRPLAPRHRDHGRDRHHRVGACEDCDGKSLPFAPEVSGSAILSYKWPMASGEGFFTTEYIYRSEMFGGPGQLPGRDGGRLGRVQLPRSATGRTIRGT